ncbi:hypothetical protein M422DRAFT_31252 [Sphaerobolus stellatus SS14]|uniref:Uncharacterized protein n=1 Tax=Sphaerobolus stellatus (strain SS14) TaxID=990650 RepID=A0A0C9VLR0_SPHS4|nr:hypothetical protein M422DRAFT_31252 [Sphaerobolus stellatus SS14]
MDLQGIYPEAPSTPRRVSKPEESFVMPSPGLTTPSYTQLQVWLGGGVSSSPTTGFQASATRNGSSGTGTPTMMTPSATRIKGDLVIREVPAPSLVSSVAKPMYAGVFEPDSDIYSETQFSSDLLGSPELHERRVNYVAHIRVWSPPRLRVERWGCRVNFYEKQWWHLDELIKSDQIFPRGSPKDLLITKTAPIPLEFDYPARQDTFCQAHVIKYIESVTLATNASHRKLNRIQGEFKLLWDDLHRLLSHMPLAHAYSDLETVQELMMAGWECMHGMRYLLEAERRARLHIDMALLSGSI